FSRAHTSPRIAPLAASEVKGKRSVSAAIADALPVDTTAAPATFVDPRLVAGGMPVGASAANVNTMAAVTVPTLAEAATRGEGDGKLENGIRAAEAAGHRRALAGVAHGRIDVPELGKIEVRAVAEASKIDVHVKAEENHTKHVIAAHAPELITHVHREIPEARVHVERPVDFANDATPRDLGRNHEERREAKREERENMGGRATSARVEIPTTDRSRARVRIVL
ncbi:MAG TPA: flagellar hook-length control protein FliK, partial [Labilithrix sp.]|nr:flagellar hook-length control protein FliK [Labilithrix sp.]